MRSTTSFTTAMHRLADALSWHVSSNGKTWAVVSVPHERHMQVLIEGQLPPSEFQGLTFRSISLLCLMTRVAMSPVRFGGLGWTAEEVRNAIELDISRDYRSGMLVLPGDTSPTDDATLSRLFKGAEDVQD